MNVMLMESLRQCILGLQPDDESRDDYITNLKPAQLLEELCAWELDDAGWAAVFLHWAQQCGYRVEATR